MHAGSDKFPKATSPQLTVEYFEKFFEGDNIEAVLSLYAEDSMYIFPPGAKPIVGLEGIRTLVEGFKQNGKNVNLNLRHVHQNGDKANNLANLTKPGWALSGCAVLRHRRNSPHTHEFEEKQSILPIACSRVRFSKY